MAKYIGSTTKIMHGDPDGFGKYYIGSTQAKKNALNRKKLAKKK